MAFRSNNKGGKKFSRRDSGKPTMHHAICSECDKECEVPFKPFGDKPVYCRDCFRGKEDSGPKKFSKRDSGGERDFGGTGMTSEQFKILNSKLDQILDMLGSAE